ncbi:MAG: hypothetical protein M1538_03765 [Candidatus Marsarchaeota archaeon]|jgi:hypothetical protein|nr:hypothetical protein [Candidatus Marsarchaeota archaeon]
MLFIPQIFSQQYTYGTVNIILSKSKITMMPNETNTINFNVVLTGGEAWGTTVKILNSQDFSTNGIGVSISNPYGKPNFTGSIMISLIPIQSGFVTYTVKPGIYPIVLIAVSGDVSTHNVTLYLDVVNKTIINSTAPTTVINTTNSTNKTNISKSSNHSSIVPTQSTSSSNTSSKNSSTVQKQQSNNNNILIEIIILVIIIIAAAFGLKKKAAKTDNVQAQPSSKEEVQEQQSPAQADKVPSNAVEPKKTEIEKSNSTTETANTSKGDKEVPKQKKQKPKKGSK